MPDEHPGYDAKRYFLGPDQHERLLPVLAPLTISILAVLVNRDWSIEGYRKGYAHPKVSTVASAVGVAERTVRRHLSILIRAGFITRCGSGGRGRPAVVAFNWRRIMGDENADPAVPVTLAETRTRRSAPTNQEKRSKQEKPVAPASSACAAPPRRGSSYALPEAVPPPPDVAATIAALFGQVGSLPSTRGRGRLEAPTPATDRGARESWLAGQWRRAKEAGLAI